MKDVPHPYSQIEGHLRRSGITDSNLLEELSDHYLSSLEHKIDIGIDQKTALAMAMNEIRIEQFEKSNKTVRRRSYHSIIALIIITLISLHYISDFKSHISKSQGTLINTTSTQQNTCLEDWPLQTNRLHITAPFGIRNHPITKDLRQHRGIDLKAKKGTPVIAPSDAIVKACGYDPKKGNYIILKHKGALETRYYHLSQLSVRPGQQLNAGFEIGKVGDSGLSRGAHLHFEVLKNQLPVNPQNYLKP